MSEETIRQFTSDQAPRRIDLDHDRFRKIVKSRVRQDLRRYITHGGFDLAKPGQNPIRVPIPHINTSRFRFGDNGGVGQGPGNIGDSIGTGGNQPGGGAGQGHGDHQVEVDLTLEELADILGEELGLPRIQPRAQETLESTKWKLRGIQPNGPEGLVHKKRTWLRALKRSIGSGEWTLGQPLKITPIRPDKRYRAFQPTTVPRTNAVVFYMMDVSGSMGEEEKTIVRTTSFWIDTWIRRHYQGIESVYIIHDSDALRVDRERFYKTTESGGTKISSALALCAELIRMQYAPQHHNLYAFHFSDGENWEGDNEECKRILEAHILPAVNLFGYGEVLRDHRDDDGAMFGRYLDQSIRDEKAIVARIQGKGAIVDAIRKFLGTGR